MKIIILGGGQVGSSIAEILSREENDVTVIDRNRHLIGHGLQRSNIFFCKGVQLVTLN